MTAADATPEQSDTLKRLFLSETLRAKRPQLVEKLPINSFRLDFLQHIFPDARFIHLYRNGAEVARSIAVMCEQGRWFGSNSYKWDRLVDLALSQGDTKLLPSLCASYFAKGLLEWRLSCEAAVTFLRRVPSETYFEVSYQELMDRPVETLRRVVHFIGVGEDDEVNGFARTELSRRTSAISCDAISEEMGLIGGPLLSLSMGCDGLVQARCP
jgi:hypothetical protein